jgi:hypothetical protein
MLLHRRDPGRWIPIVGVGFALLAAIALYLPWHLVERDERGSFVDGGVAHAGLLPVGLLGLCCTSLVVAAVWRTRLAWRIAGAVGGLAALGAGAVVILSTFLAHFLSRFDTLMGEPAFYASLYLALVFASLVFGLSWRITASPAAAMAARMAWVRSATTGGRGAG